MCEEAPFTVTIGARWREKDWTELLWEACGGQSPRHTGLPARGCRAAWPPT